MPRFRHTHEGAAPTVCDSGAEASVAGTDAELTDAELVARALANDRAARETIVRRHAKRLRGIARRLVRSREAAEDLAHDTFIYALEHLDTIRNPNALGAWLSQIVVWRSISFLRREKLRRRIGLSSVIAESQYVPLVETELPSSVARQDAKRLLEQLPTEARVMWWLQRVEGHTVKEVAVLTNSTVDKVKKRLVAAEKVMAKYRAGEEL